MNNIVIERVHSDEIECNDNNNPIDPDDQEADMEKYEEMVGKTKLHHYMDMINYPVAFTYDLTETEAGVFIESIPTSYITGRPNSIFEEEIEAIIARMEYEIGEKWKTMSNHGWFVRMTDCSGKDGNPYKFPLMTIRQLVQQLGSSRRILISLYKGSRRLYFVPFDPTWEEFRELRVFIHNRKLTALSQYIWHKFALYSCMTEDELKSMVVDLQEYLDKTLPPILDKLETDSVVVDIYWQEDGNFRIIEFNSFGYWLASGAALFHWMNDRDKLYGKTDKIYFRVSY